METWRRRYKIGRELKNSASRIDLMVDAYYMELLANNKLFFFFKYTVDLLQMLEFNMNVTFPVASFFTVILALVGMSLLD